MTTVLLVDDEKLILRSLEKTLLRAGFDVITAANCKSGSEIFTQNSDTIDIAVLDLNMPSFDGTPKTGAGLDLLADLKSKKPSLPVVILTAYDEVTKAKESVSGGASAFFVKGREQGLVELIQKILNA
jgi:DNA-binding NtrC family response regulator